MLVCQVSCKQFSEVIPRTSQPSGHLILAIFCDSQNGRCLSIASFVLDNHRSQQSVANNGWWPLSPLIEIVCTIDKRLSAGPACQFPFSQARKAFLPDRIFLYKTAVIVASLNCLCAHVPRTWVTRWWCCRLGLLPYAVLSKRLAVAFLPLYTGWGGGACVRLACKFMSLFASWLLVNRRSAVWDLTYDADSVGTDATAAVITGQMWQVWQGQYSPPAGTYVVWRLAKVGLEGRD